MSLSIATLATTYRKALDHTLMLFAVESFSVGFTVVPVFFYLRAGALLI